MKYYFFGLLAFLALTVYTLDNYMTTKRLLWSAVVEVWPLWLLSTVLGFLAGGLVWGGIAQLASQRDKQIQRKQLATEKQNYQHDLYYRLESREFEIKAAEAKQQQREQRAAATLETANQLRAKAQRLITETQTENEQLKKAVFNASKVVERLRKKHKRDLAQLSPTSKNSP